MNEKSQEEINRELRIALKRLVYAANSVNGFDFTACDDFDDAIAAAEKLLEK